MKGTAVVVGGGGREHALAWALERSGQFARVYAAPGNAGTPHPVPLPAGAAEAAEALVTFAREHDTRLVVVGPEAPLAAGLADRLREAGVPVVGPSRSAARIESSKAFAKTVMARAGVPTAPFRIFFDPERALAYVRKAGRPLVVKADGLAAGKGAIVCDTPREAEQAVQSLMVQRTLGDAGGVVIVEERLEGRELSVMILTDGERALLLPPARDHKRLLDGDRGPNTGGMGAVAPVEGETGLQDVLQRIFYPVLRELAAAGSPFRGVLYAGLMLTPEGPQVLEFNCRAGDPETQAQLPLLDARRFTEALLAVAGVPGATLPDDPGWLWPGPLAGLEGRHAVCVVAASAGYPERPRTGDLVEGLEEAAGALEAADDGTLVFHAATRRRAGGRVETAGGRILNVVGLGATWDEARRRAYDRLSRISFDGMQYRSDIGLL
ncbi:phosphoribosylamine--glycine ligase [Carboxydochorda subterranea]|uniref:Phosphoribosylamine--glycine ligase n=1 Tax=Carboxydichorda subterranea TaxID=3109565 RepID=A0ABZ1BW58_9FIRM|nr:phosphoribosylamine--glycine ligase [Limnochorda sp. L945t]WRP16845.1 phosphoribosylamine--glycine ligase [Limnochorda sp. L945t]